MRFFTIIIAMLLCIGNTHDATAKNLKDKKSYYINDVDIDKINELIKNNKPQEAIKHIDKIIEDSPKSVCELLPLKALILMTENESDAAIEIYESTIVKCKNNERATEGIAIAYILQAQNLKDKSLEISDKDELEATNKKVCDLYEKSIPYLEKHLKMVKKRTAEKDEVKSALLKLQNVYYNLILLNVDKEKEFQKIEIELGKP